MTQLETSARHNDKSSHRLKKIQGPMFIDDSTSDLLHLDTMDIRRNGKHVAALAKLGIFTRKGRWSKQEDELLMGNLSTYLARNPVDDPAKLVNSQMDKQIKKLIDETNFYAILCKNLNRTTPSVYCRLKYTLLFNGKRGKFTKEETEQLIQLVGKYGKKYNKIGQIMKRSIRSLVIKYDLSKKPVKNGIWTTEEENNLLHGLRTVMHTEDLSKLRTQPNIRFREVAEYVPTRHELQCNQHFRRVKNYKLDTPLTINNNWTKSHSKLLVKNLYEEGFEDESDIDWNEVNSLFTDVSPSAAYLQGRFHTLKSSVEKNNIMPFCEILASLHNKYNTDD